MQEGFPEADQVENIRIGPARAPYHLCAIRRTLRLRRILAPLGPEYPGGGSCFRGRLTEACPPATGTAFLTT